MEALLSQLLEWLDRSEGVISAIVGMIIIAGGTWSLFFSGAKATPVNERGKSERNASTTSDLATKPSIAVLPFTIIGDQEALEQLTDALTQDLISLLSRSPYFFVISRNSCFVYKGRHVDVRDAATELGVRYVVEGRVRQLGERYRVDVELIDGETGAHLWVDNFNCELEELLDAQADVMQAISTQLLNPIMLTETSRVERSSTRNMSAWLLTQQAIRQYYITTSGSERVSSTQPLLTQALKFDANYAPALALKGLIHCTSILIHQSKNIVADRKLAKSSCEKAYQLAPMDPSVLWCCGVTWCFLESTERGLPLLGKSIEMDPNNAHAIADYGYQLCRAGRSEEGIECIERAFKHSPKDPRHHIWTFFLGYAHASDVPKALEFFKQSINLDASYIPPWIGRLLAQLALQQLEEAKITAKHLQVLSPGINKESVLRQFASGGSQDPAMLDFYMELLGRTRLFE